MWLKLLLLSLYLLLLFFLSRLLEAASWYHGTSSFLNSRVILDPFSLSVRKLKELLDNRGVSYSGMVEKNELIDLVEASGSAVEEELSEGSTSRSVENHQTTHFTCGSHFYEEVEDTKDSVWLVQVITSDEHTSFDESTWREVISKVAIFGMRTGIFRCSLDNRLCARKGWTSPRLILALPRGNKAKEDVVLHNFAPHSKPPAILHWVRKQLTSRVQQINSKEELENSWIKYDEFSKQSEIRVIFFSKLLAPPLFLSSLAIKFTGRVKFGMVHVASNDIVYKEFTRNSNLPVYLVITPEKHFHYGVRRGESFSFKSMEIFLKSLRPEINDIFLWSLFLVNAIAGFELFLMYGQFWKHFIRYTMYVVKYNCALFLGWLLILALYQFSFMTAFTEISLKCLRIINGTDAIALLRNDWKNFYSYPFLIVTFALFGSIAGFVIKKWGRAPTEEDTALFPNSWSVPWDSYLMTYFFQPMSGTLTSSMMQRDFDLEEGMELLIERLAVPNFWLQPVISTDYIKDLPLWKYRGWCEADDSLDENKHDVLSSSEDESAISTDVVKITPKCIANQTSCSCNIAVNHFHLNNSDGKREGKCAENANKVHKINVSSHESQDSKCVVCDKHNCTTPCDNLCISVRPNEYLKSSNCRCSTKQSCDSLVPDSKICDSALANVTPKAPEVQRAPAGMLEFRECSICLESYRYGEILCGLPCGHNYHMNCIMLWLSRDNHCCPICRWPSYKFKQRLIHSHVQ